MRQRLNRQCRKQIQRGHADGTRANQRTHFKSYNKFCTEYCYQPFPADDWRYCQYAQYLHIQGKKPGTVDNYVSTVRVLHRLQNLLTPTTGQIHYKLISELYKKFRKEPVRQATPMSHQMLLKLVERVNLDQELEAVAWTSVLVGFSMILRVSNLGPHTRSKFDPNNHFLRSDLVVKQGLWSLGVR